MPDIVDQRGDHRVIITAGLGCEIGCLQHMLGHGHRFAQIFLSAVAAENINNGIDDLAPCGFILHWSAFPFPWRRGWNGARPYQGSSPEASGHRCHYSRYGHATPAYYQQ